MNAAILVLAAAIAGPGQVPAELRPAEPPPILIPAPRPRVDLVPPQGPLPAPARVAEFRGPKRDMVLAWNEAALRAIQTERTTPPVAARNLAIVHGAVYDAVNAVERTHQAFLATVPAPAESSAEAAAAGAAHLTLVTLFPRRAVDFDRFLDSTLATIPDGPARTNGVRLGQTVAVRILEARAKDGEGRTSYRVRIGLGNWQPTPPDYRPPLLPQWASVRCFALPRPAEFHPPGPPALTSDDYVASYREVKALGAADSATRTRDQTEIARFWADGEGTATPPGHWNRIAQTVAAQRGTSLAENARLFAMLNVALADAAIACWDCKFQFNVWRPVTAIRTAAKINNPDFVADPDWTPLLATPPFPSYTSGHSTFSGAGAAALAEFFGTDDVRFSSTSDALPGVTRSYSGFRAAADEAGRSRIYGGIHWEFDNRDGLDAGRKVGEYVSKHFFQPVDKAKTDDRQ